MQNLKQNIVFIKNLLERDKQYKQKANSKKENNAKNLEEETNLIQKILETINDPQVKIIREGEEAREARAEAPEQFRERNSKLVVEFKIMYMKVVNLLLFD